MNTRILFGAAAALMMALPLQSQVALQGTDHPLAVNPDFVDALVDAPDAPAADPARSYEFTGQYEVMISQQTADATLPQGNYTVHWRTQDDCVGIQGQRSFGSELASTRVIVDVNTECRYTIIKQDDTSPIGLRSSAEDNAVTLRSDIEFEATGQTRTIAGYTCEKYTWSESGTDFEAWVSTADTHIPQHLKKWLGPSGIELLHQNAPDGSILELTVSGAGRDASTTYTIQNIAPEKHATIRAAGVDFIQEATLNQ